MLLPEPTSKFPPFSLGTVSNELLSTAFYFCVLFFLLHCSIKKNNP